MKLQKQTLLIVYLLLTSTYCFADIYNCDGQWTNKRCDSDVEPVLTEKVVVTEPSTKASHERENPVDKTGVSTTDQISMRYPILDRSDPVVEASEALIAEKKYRVTARVIGQGKTRVRFVLYWRDHGSQKVRERTIRFKTIELAPRGTSKNLEFDYRVPSSAAKWWWSVKPEYVGSWRGYHDLSGCCAHHDGITAQRCGNEGVVVCSDGTTSRTCRCK